MAGSDEKIGDEEKHHTGAPVVAPFDLNDFTVIKEGEAEILMHVKNEVFYNKTQVNNRDMSIAVLRTFISKRKEEHEAMLSRKKKTGPKDSGEPIVEPEALTDTVMHDEKSNGECEVSQEISQVESASISEDQAAKQEGKGKGELKPPRVLEALSASGLRAIRYAREVDGIGQVVALDNDKVSVESCRRNIKFNGSVACSKVESNLADARVYMLTHPKEFDVVDLDPYGSPSVFLDSAVQSVVDGGILMCTATDMAVLCGGNGEVCYSKYGSYPLRGKYCHEMALRILLACIEVKPGEALALTSILSLHVLLAEDDRVDAQFGLSKNNQVKECKRMKEFLEMVKSIGPKVVLLVEQESNHNSSRLVDRFVEGLHFYSALFDSIDVAFGGSSCSDRTTLEEMFGQEIENVVAGEGMEREKRHERYAKWAVRFGRAGFRPVRLWYETMDEAQQVIEAFGPGGFKIISQKGCLMICWHDRPIYAVSAWNCFTC